MGTVSLLLRASSNEQALENLARIVAGIGDGDLEYARSLFQPGKPLLVAHSVPPERAEELSAFFSSIGLPAERVETPTAGNPAGLKPGQDLLQPRPSE